MYKKYGVFRSIKHDQEMRVKESVEQYWEYIRNARYKHYFISSFLCWLKQNVSCLRRVEMNVELVLLILFHLIVFNRP